MDRRNNHSNFHTEITLFKTARFAGFSATQFRGVYSYILPAGALPRLVSNVQSVSGGSDESVELVVAEPVRIRPQDRGGLRSSRAESGPQVLPPARATVPP